MHIGVTELLVGVTTNDLVPVTSENGKGLRFHLLPLLTVWCTLYDKRSPRGVVFQQTGYTLSLGSIVESVPSLI